MFTLKIVELDKYQAFSVDSYVIKQQHKEFIEVGLVPVLSKLRSDPEHGMQWFTLDSGKDISVYIENAAGKTIDTIHMRDR